MKNSNRGQSLIELLIAMAIFVLVISAITQRTGFKFSPETDGEYFEADDYMEKPVKPADLLKRVENLLEG